ncbi:hypothetical protein C2G38_2142388 [Gigaspora rosea]|uniref:Uncharacterized protein n=1 Tax=Gigaspora rosea TaxID=44941 RepID=A0A397V618_9GLOM|nr:hypothetical protein C2G38_2142388 [Gigaspora rosea]
MPVIVFYPIQRNRFNHLRSNLKIGKLLMISGYLHIVKSTIMIEATDIDYLRQDTIYNTTKTLYQPSLPAFTDLDKIAEEINTPNPSIQKKQNIVNLDDINTNTIPTTNEDNESTFDEKKIKLETKYNLNEEINNELTQNKKKGKRKNYKNNDQENPQQTSNTNYNLEEEITANENKMKTDTIRTTTIKNKPSLKKQKYLLISKYTN